MYYVRLHVLHYNFITNYETQKERLTMTELRTRWEILTRDMKNVRRECVRCYQHEEKSQN